MPRYEVQLCESYTVYQSTSIEVTASSEAEALTIARNRYNSGEEDFDWYCYDTENYCLDEVEVIDTYEDPIPTHIIHTRKPS